MCRSPSSLGPASPCRRSFKAIGWRAAGLAINSPVHRVHHTSSTLVHQVPAHNRQTMPKIGVDFLTPEPLPASSRLQGCSPSAEFSA
mmetsp:Transcript_15231/g.20628  ORF Transcript_15231/g.20628 Transcript_15231/m.20628 type:complete len:87 (-) Transcript_15231:204-464(-)